MQDFFFGFPTTPYSVDGLTKTVTNLAVAELTLSHTSDQSYIIWQAQIVDDETPVTISKRFYKKADYYWVVMYINNVINPYTDWYLNQTKLELFCKRKYKDSPNGINGIHHFEENDSNGFVLDDVAHAEAMSLYNADPQSIGSNIIPVTNLTYERRKNDLRKNIRLINPEYIGEFVETFKKLMAAKNDLK